MYHEPSYLKAAQVRLSALQARATRVEALLEDASTIRSRESLEASLASLNDQINDTDEQLHQARRDYRRDALVTLHTLSTFSKPSTPAKPSK